MFELFELFYLVLVLGLMRPRLGFMLNFHAHLDQTLALAVQFWAEKDKEKILFSLWVYVGVKCHI